MNLHTNLHKWRQFSYELSNHALEKQKGLVGTVTFVMKKHFTHRVIDRFVPGEYKTIRRMLYHVVNQNMCELLFWYYSDIQKDVAIKRDDLYIILTRGRDCFLLTTIYRSEREDNDKFFLIDLNKKWSKA
ncbi:hypothetical protein VPFG_00075 [Vibrio phage nt-1]|uniref:Uncharacterized protein n=1 Tax=Vibrio phage nt-1 TaxID=115992 RepID=R9TJ05_9CAUD|nr:hypothetical protein VPFG_00075 [Vibrio phage nt-1]AGN30077.1 hypothetical protein VPFG_00075 [Vibrio phage nt-1]